MNIPYALGGEPNSCVACPQWLPSKEDRWEGAKGKLYVGKRWRTLPPPGEQGQHRRWKMILILRALDVMLEKGPSPLLPQIRQSPSNQEKDLGLIPMKGPSANAWLAPLQTAKVIRKQGKPEKLSQPRGTPGERTTEHKVVSWMRPWNRKGH